MNLKKILSQIAKDATRESSDETASAIATMEALKKRTVIEDALANILKIREVCDIFDPLNPPSDKAATCLIMTIKAYAHDAIKGEYAKREKNKTLGHFIDGVKMMPLGENGEGVIEVDLNNTEDLKADRVIN